MKTKKKLHVVSHFNYLFLIFISLKLLPVFFKLTRCFCMSRIIIYNFFISSCGILYFAVYLYQYLFQFFFVQTLKFLVMKLKNTSLKCLLLEKKNDFLKNRKYAYLKCLKNYLWENENNVPKNHQNTCLKYNECKNYVDNLKNFQVY